jgi:hypothetical protein
MLDAGLLSLDVRSSRRFTGVGLLHGGFARRGAKGAGARGLWSFANRTRAAR